MQRFPDIPSLAAAPQSEVMTLWAGLGYYARGRNLHAAARQVVAQHGGVLPSSVDDLQALPGIGRSTAGAIRSLGHGLPAAILDGNVKRVLARHAAIDGWPGRTAVQNRLWALAEARTPDTSTAEYNQGMMDLGALLCTRRQAACGQCPVHTDCLARQQGRQAQLPTPKPRKAKPRQTMHLLLLTRQGRTLLPRRPAAGIWGGLRAPPQADGNGDAEIDAALQRLQLRAVGAPMSLPEIRHELTHRSLSLQATRLEVEAMGVQDAHAGDWLDPTQARDVPTPIRRLLDSLEPQHAMP